MKKENKLNQNVISRLTRGSTLSLSSSGLTRGSRGMIFHNNKASESTGFRIKSGMTQGLLALTLILGLAVTGPAQAALNCTSELGGVPFKGANNVDYCVSTIKMNWFSAFSWCKAAGGKLATVDEACPSTGFATCTNVKNKQSTITGEAWLATPYADQYAYYVNLSSGAVYGYNYYRNYYNSALCK